VARIQSKGDGWVDEAVVSEPSQVAADLNVGRLLAALQGKHNRMEQKKFSRSWID
jgi:hypothetical protein